MDAEKAAVDSVLSQHMAREVPSEVFHYTNARGFLGILESRQLWLSNIQYLNDEQEFEYGFEQLRAYVAEYRNKTFTHDSKGRVLYGILNMLGDAKRSSVSRLYVGSWSEAPDDLSQWRAYSRKGTGYVVGARGLALAEVARKQGFSFCACIYRPEEHKELVAKIVGPVLLPEVMEAGHDVVRKAQEHAVRSMLDVAPLMKHPAFAGEREWRLVADDVDPAHLREGRSTLIPYCRFELEASISRIVVGPSPNKLLAIEGAKVAVALHGLQCSVQPSDVPYRTW